MEKSLAFTVENGRFLTETNWLKILVRNCSLWCLQSIPNWKRWLEQGHRKEGMVRYKYEPGMAFMPSTGGFCFPQVYCVKLAAESTEASRVRFTDDVIYAPSKQGSFQIVVLLRSLDEYKSAADALRDLDVISNGEIRANETTYILHECNPHPDNASHYGNVYRIATGTEFAQDASLCASRPPPIYYDEYRMLRETKGKRFVVVRPDRFVFAACSGIEELNAAASAVASLTQGGVC